MEICKNDSHKLMKSLAQLKSVNVNSHILKITNIEKKLKQLGVRKCDKYNPTIKILIINWREQAKKQSKSKDKFVTVKPIHSESTPVIQSRDGSLANCTEELKSQSEEFINKDTEEKDSKANISEQIIKFLNKCFTDYDKSLEEKALILSKNIESFISSQHEIGSQKYSTKARTILANLKRNKDLIALLIDDKITIQELFSMDICEMADLNVKNKRKEHQDSEKERYALRGNRLA